MTPYVSVVAAAIQLTIAAAALALGRAPGREALRWFAVIAGCAAAYSATNVVFATTSDAETVRVATRFNYAFACLHMMGWLFYAARWHERELGPFTRGGAILLAALGLASLVPGTVVSDGPPHTSPVWGGTLTVVDLALGGQLVGLALLGVLAVVTADFVRSARGGRSGAAAHALGLAIFACTGALEVASALGLLALPYLADVGFVSVIVAVAGTNLRSVVEDGRRLQEVAAALGTEVGAQRSALAQARTALVQSEQFAALGQLAAGLAHEINNPLQVLSAGIAEALERGRSAERPALESMQRNVDLIARVVADLAIFSRARAAPTCIDLARVVDAALSLVGHDLRRRTRIERAFRKVPPVFVDPTTMAQVVVSLVNQVASDIAVGAADEHILHVSIGPHLGGAIRLEISHRGAPRTGRPPTFRRLVTPGTRQMGLSLCAAVVEAAGGTLELHSSSSGGSRLGVILPAAPEGSLPSTAPWETSSDPGDQPVPRARVLVVDDDELVAAVFKAALDRHDVTVCQSGRLAIEALAAEEFDAVVCDLMMPDTSGIDVWEAVQLVSPERARRMLFLTGGAFTDRARTFVAQQAERVLYKPVRAAELRRAVEAVLAGTPIPHPAPPRD